MSQEIRVSLILWPGFYSVQLQRTSSWWVKQLGWILGQLAQVKGSTADEPVGVYSTSGCWKAALPEVHAEQLQEAKYLVHEDRVKQTQDLIDSLVI